MMGFLTTTSWPLCVSPSHANIKKTFPNLSYFYVKGFHKTFWGTTKKCRNKNFKLFFILLSPFNTIYTPKWFRYFEDKTIHVFHRWKTCLRFLQRNFSGIQSFLTVTSWKKRRAGDSWMAGELSGYPCFKRSMKFLFLSLIKSTKQISYL